MGQWVRECTRTADIKDSQSHQRWFEFMNVSGKGFARADVLLLEEVKRAVRKDPHLKANIMAKEQEFQRVTLDCKGRQAAFMTRDHCREPRSDRQPTDRRKINGITMRGGNIEGPWADTR